MKPNYLSLISTRCLTKPTNFETDGLKLRMDSDDTSRLVRFLRHTVLVLSCTVCLWVAVQWIVDNLHRFCRLHRLSQQDYLQVMGQLCGVVNCYWDWD